MYWVIWTFVVPAGNDVAFRAMYGRNGDWVRFFRQHHGYLGTELLQGELPGRYLAYDRWESEADYRACLERDPAGYAAIDAKGIALALNEQMVGRYHNVC